MDYLLTNLTLPYVLMTSVFVGVIVICMLNLCLGFSLSGLVVPGFLVPILLTHPLTGVVIFVEGLLTYLLVRFIYNVLAKSPHVSRYFGRDRFFAILICSIFIRLFVEQLLPSLFFSLKPMPYLQSQLQHMLSSLGLVLVPLLANQFWKAGFRQGLIAFSISSSCVALGVSTLLYLLPINIEELGISLGQAANLVPDSGQAYILLMTTVFIASRFNLAFGWDVSGILFPGLVALCLFDPARLLYLALEILVVVSLVKLIFQFEKFKTQWNEGAKAVLLCFSIVFVYKTVTGFLFSQIWLGRADDFYGLGFVISSLISIKVVKNSGYSFHLTAATGVITALGVGLGSLLSMGLYQLDFKQNWLELYASPAEVDRATKKSLQSSHLAKGLDQPRDAALSFPAYLERLSISSQLTTQSNSMDREKKRRVIDSVLHSVVDHYSNSEKSMDITNFQSELMRSPLVFRMSLSEIDKNEGRKTFTLHHDLNPTDTSAIKPFFAQLRSRESTNLDSRTLKIVVVQNEEINTDLLQFAWWFATKSAADIFIFEQASYSIHAGDLFNNDPYYLSHRLIANLQNHQKIEHVAIDLLKLNSHWEENEADFKVSTPTYESFEELETLLSEERFSLRQTTTLESPYILEQIAKVKDSTLRKIEVSSSAVLSVSPLAGQVSAFEKHWHASGRPTVTVDSKNLKNMKIVTASDSELIEPQVLKDFLATANPYRLFESDLGDINLLSSNGQVFLKVVEDDNLEVIALTPLVAAYDSPEVFQSAH